MANDDWNSDELDPNTTSDLENFFEIWPDAPNAPTIIIVPIGEHPSPVNYDLSPELRQDLWDLYNDVNYANTDLGLDIRIVVDNNRAFAVDMDKPIKPNPLK